MRHIHSLVVIPDAVNLVLCIYSEWHAIQALITDDAAEATRVIGFAQCLQDLGGGQRSEVILLASLHFQICGDLNFPKQGCDVNFDH